jgi:hypothetical protein
MPKFQASRKPKRQPNRQGRQPSAPSTALTVLGGQTIRNLPPAIRNVVHKFCRTVQLSSAAGGVAANSLSYAFAFSDLPGYTEFTTLYDQYRFESIELVMIPSITMLPANYPIVGSNVSVLDYDDSVALASANLALQYETAIIHPIDEKFMRVVKPRCALQANNANSGASAGQANMEAQWCDSANPGIPHYGLKVYLGAESSSGSNYVTYSVFARYWFHCRQTR